MDEQEKYESIILGDLAYVVKVRGVEIGRTI